MEATIYIGSFIGMVSRNFTSVKTILDCVLWSPYKLHTQKAKVIGIPKQKKPEFFTKTSFFLKFWCYTS